MSGAPTEQRTQGTRAWRYLLAAVLGLAPAYGLAICMHLSLGRAYTMTEMLAYPLVFGGGTLALIWVLITRLCGERLVALNPGAGSLSRDLLEGIGLLILMVVLAAIERSTLYRWLPSSQRGDFSNLIRGLLENPLLMAL